MTNNVNTTKIDDLTVTLNDMSTVFTNSGSSIYSVIPGAVGTSYQWGANGTSQIDWGNTSITSGTSNGLWTSTTNPGTVNLSGTMDLRGEKADIKVNGRSLMSAIENLEERLNILVPNPELEAEWDELKELGDRYRALEKQCKEKGEMWKKLKSMPPTTD